MVGRGRPKKERTLDRQVVLRLHGVTYAEYERVAGRLGVDVSHLMREALEAALVGRSARRWRFPWARC